MDERNAFSDMSFSDLPGLLPGCAIDTIQSVNQTLVIEAHRTSRAASCPMCQQPSRRIHGCYRRAPRDLPISDQPVRLLLHVRRFVCTTPTCPRRTFAERFPDMVPVRAQRTTRLTRTVRSIAMALGGNAGSRLARQLQMKVSHDTLTRLIRQTPTAPCVTPRVVGVDDFALQKGRIYGTLLVDLDQRQPIDLLPDRTADTFATWLRAHPGVEVIVRDRSPDYARGASDGAPHARQVADRWHILKNHREALERMLNRLHADLARLPMPSGTDTPSPARTSVVIPLRPASLRDQADRQATHERRAARHAQVQALVQQGVPIAQIARRLGMGRTTVRLCAAAATCPEQARRAPQPRMIDPYVSYLQQRWAEGCTNASQLWREIQAQGYPGGRKQVARWVQQHRVEPASTGRNPQHTQTTGHGHGAACDAQPVVSRPLLAPRRLVWLVLRSPGDLDTDEAVIAARIQQHPEMTRAHTLAQEFQALVRQRRANGLDAWLAASQASGIPELQRFATGLQHEYASIRAALSEPWSTGQVEGQITRVKLVKRQMYGRAKFDLLKQRVLHQT